MAARAPRPPSAAGKGLAGGQTLGCLERRGEADVELRRGTRSGAGRVLAPAQRGEQGGFDMVATGGSKVLEIRREQGVAGGCVG